MEKNKKTTKLDEKSLRVLSCALAVGVMILLMSGDMIITKFIKVKPNQLPKDEIVEPGPSDDTSVNETPKDEFDVSFYQQVSLDVLVEKIEKGETVVYFSGRFTCPPCHSFLPILTEVLKENNMTTAYYIDRSTIKANMPAYEKLVQMDSFISENFGGTPLLLLFHDGKYQNGLSGYYGDDATKTNIKTVLKSIE